MARHRLLLPTELGTLRPPHSFGPNSPIAQAPEWDRGKHLGCYLIWALPHFLCPCMPTEHFTVAYKVPRSVGSSTGLSPDCQDYPSRSFCTSSPSSCVPVRVTDFMKSRRSVHTIDARTEQRVSRTGWSSASWYLQQQPVQHRASAHPAGQLRNPWHGP